MKEVIIETKSGYAVIAIHGQEETVEEVIKALIKSRDIITVMDSEQKGYENNTRNTTNNNEVWKEQKG